MSQKILGFSQFYADKLRADQVGADRVGADLISHWRSALWAFCLIIGVQTTFAATPRPSADIDGAFGLKFDEPVIPAQLTANLANPAYSPSENAPQPATPLPGMDTLWHRFAPTLIPDVLSGQRVIFTVLLNERDEPVRILAEFSDPQSCEDLGPRLLPILKRKYDPYKTNKATTLPLLFNMKERQVTLHCNESKLLLEYTNLAQLEPWNRMFEGKILAFQNELARRASDLKEQEERLAAEEKERQIAFADTFTLGNSRRLEGAFGTGFRNKLSGFNPSAFDVSVSWQPSYLSAEFSSGNFAITMSPDNWPIKIEAELAENETLYSQILEALNAKYSTKIKSTERHQIYNVSGDLIALRKLSSGAFRLVFIHRSGQQELRKRAKKEEALLQAERDRQWQQENRGI